MDAWDRRTDRRTSSKIHIIEITTSRNYPFYIAGGLKIGYDLLLLGAFASVKPPEEHGLGVKGGETAPLTGVTVKI